MTYWLAASLIAMGYLLRMGWERSSRVSDIDDAVDRRRERTRTYTRDG